MKKSLLLLASMLMSVASFAQWTKPVATGQDMVLNDTVYLYNVEANGFLLGANDWNTRASVGSKGYKVIIQTEKGEFTADTDCYLICDSVETQGETKAMFADNAQAIWVDNLSGANVEAWKINKLANGNYEIVNSGISESQPLGVAEYYAGETGNTRLWLYDTSLTYDSGEEEGLPLFSGEFWSEWKFISPTEYATLQPKVAAYRAALSLKAALDAAKAEYPSLDFSAQEAVYNNTSSTDVQLAAAEAEVQNIIIEYKVSLATYDEPLDFTDQIGDGSDVSYWTQEFTGDGTTGSHTTNTWSTEADNGGDGTDMTTPFCEHWTGSGGILSDQKIYQKLTSLAPGLYKLTIDARAYSEAGGIEAFEGLKMYFGNDTINLQDEVDMYLSGTKCVLWSKDYFTIISILKEAGDVEFGFEIKDANWNWLAFKNTSLKYYGNKDVEANAVKLLKASYSYEKAAAEDYDANPSYVEAYNAAVDAFDAATEKAEIKETAKAASAAKAALDDNVTAYENLLAKITSWETAVESGTQYAGENWDAFTEFVTMEDEVEGYPTPIPFVIKEGDRSLTTEEISTYISTVDSLYSNAVATSLVPGADCTGMLVNPDFGSGTNSFSTEGWTGGATLGGLKSYMCAERYSTTVDFYQTVKDAPAGIYKIETHAFVRPSANTNDWTGDEDINCWLYMNNFRSTVQHILVDAIPAGEAQNMVNSYTDGPTEEAFYPSNTWTTGYDYLYQGEVTTLPNGKYSDAGFYVPNCMIGASYAFQSGRYAVTTYGLVGEGEDMKIGITSDGQTVHWFLFSGFKLTYEGKSAEALEQLLPTYVEQLENYIEENEDNITNPVLNAATEALDDAKDALTSGDADLMWDNLINVNAHLTAAKENVAAYEAYNDAVTALDDALATYESTASAEALNAYTELANKMDGVEDMTTEEVKALTEEVESVTAAIKIPGTDTASDDNPVEFTQVIVNADIEEGATVGWTYTKNGGNGPSLTSGIDGQSVEFWNGSATSLEFNIYQVLSNLPAGTYELTAMASNSFNGVEADATAYTEGTANEGRAYLYAMTADGSVAASTPVIPQEAGCTEQYETYSVIFTLTEDKSDVTIGFQSVGTMAARWFVCDNFTLKCYGTNSSKENTADQGAVDIATISTKNAPSAIYTVSGARVNALQKGINIVKMSDGSIRKVLVK